MCEDEILTKFVQQVGDAIRAAEGSSDKIAPVDFSERILNLSSGGGESSYVYNVNTSSEVTVSSEALKKIKEDPNAIIVETDSSRPSPEIRNYKRFFDFNGNPILFGTIYEYSGLSNYNGCYITFRTLNTTTGVLSAISEQYFLSQDEAEKKFLSKPSTNPTENSVPQVSSTGSVKWKAISDFLEKRTDTTELGQAYVKEGDGSQIMIDITKNYPTVNSLAQRSDNGNVRNNTPVNAKDCTTKEYVDGNFIPSKTTVRITPADGATVTLAELGSAPFGFLYVGGAAIKGGDTDLPRGYYWMVKSTAPSATGDLAITALASTGKMYKIVGGISGNPKLQGWTEVGGSATAASEYIDVNSTTSHWGRFILTPEIHKQILSHLNYTIRVHIATSSVPYNRIREMYFFPTRDDTSYNHYTYNTILYPDPNLYHGNNSENNVYQIQIPKTQITESTQVSISSTMIRVAPDTSVSYDALLLYKGSDLNRTTQYVQESNYAKVNKIKTLFGNQSIYNTDSTGGNIDLYRHNITISNEAETAKCKCEIISSNNLAVDSLTDFQTLVKDENFFTNASGRYLVGGTIDGFITGVTYTGVEIGYHGTGSEDDYDIIPITWATWLSEAAQLNFTDSMSTI